ncbi:MAG: hypothetical protein N3A66_08650, partial [Planctomycetota bacterium]|nr:hypothetical protein [Planctomycetota bacterium]
MGNFFASRRVLLLGMAGFLFARVALAAAIEHYSIARAAEETKATDGWSVVATTPASIPGSSFAIGKRYLLLCWGYHNTENTADRSGIRVTHGGVPFTESETTEKTDRTNFAYKRAYFWFTVWTAANEDLQVEYFRNSSSPTRVARVQDITLIAIYAEDLIANGDLVYDIQTG